MNKPYSQACENNKHAILSKLSQHFSELNNVIEIGTGTAQHATFFAQHLPQLNWQTTDLAINHQGINAWLNEANLTNLNAPITLDLNVPWPAFEHTFDGLFTANTLHIIAWPLVVKFFAGIADSIAKKGAVCIYGPFNYQGKYTSASNAEFDLWLKERDPLSGIRDIEAIEELAINAGLTLQTDYAMPANNRLLVFRKSLATKVGK
jgi:hypothetical protein